MAKKKFYVVWEGRNPGVYDTWEDCSRQISGFTGAVYKSFPAKEQAEDAYRSASADFIGKDVKVKETLSVAEIKAIGTPVWDSISVDGAWNTATGDAEYQGVHTKTKQQIFRMGPFRDGTNNIVEFLGIVHALAYCKQNNITLPIYSDSRNAIKWVKDKEARTKQERTERNKKIFELVDRAVSWLKNNKYQNKVLKWETKAWGENPADFGRK